MSHTLVETRRRIRSAEGLKSVVRTMKTLALVSLGPFERVMQTLEEYEKSIAAGFRAILWNAPPEAIPPLCEAAPGPVGAIVFGTDHGMAADFNDRLARFVGTELRNRPEGCFLWPVGELVAHRLEGFAPHVAAPYRVPETVESVPGLLSHLVRDIELRRSKEGLGQVRVLFMRPVWGVGCEPTSTSLLPLDHEWVEWVRRAPWPSRRLPEAFQDPPATLAALGREHLFACLFRACVQSGAAEHAVRLAAMQRAERNIGDLLESLGREYHQQRQAAISEELFDVLAGFEVLKARS